MAQSGLLDFLQAASNEAAGTVAAPVDLLAWLARKAGVPVGDAPVGGSEWQKRKGLMVDVPQSAASLAGSTVGLLAPVAAAAKAPQIAKGLLQAGDNLAAPRTLNPQTGAIVWHGSPHKFDKFDASKIGTGEGAQAYGHGLYLADSQDVARTYANSLTDINGGPVKLDTSSMIPRPRYGSVQDGIDSHNRLISRLEADASKGDEFAKKQLPYLREKVRKISEQAALYKVDLPDEQIAKMLDWDKPLSEQAPEVQRALAHKPAKYAGREYSADELISAMMEGRQLPSLQVVTQEQISPLSKALGMFREKNMSTKPPTGEQVYRALADQYGHDKAAKIMRDAGIPGIRYLDGGSRAVGSGSQNYVIFPGEENALTILERNGHYIKP